MSQRVAVGPSALNRRREVAFKNILKHVEEKHKRSDPEELPSIEKHYKESQILKARLNNS